MNISFENVGKTLQLVRKYDVLNSSRSRNVNSKFAKINSLVIFFFAT
jgi:hypothetical protein